MKTLKGNEHYKGVSIKEDYTYNERQIIKDYIEQANALNVLKEKKKIQHYLKITRHPKKLPYSKEVHHNKREQPDQ